MTEVSTKDTDRKTPGPKKWTEKEEIQLLELIKAKKQDADIAAVLGRSVGAFRIRLNTIAVRKNDENVPRSQIITECDITDEILDEQIKWAEKKKNKKKVTLPATKSSDSLASRLDAIASDLQKIANEVNTAKQYLPRKAELSKET